MASSKHGVDDMVMLSRITEEAILENLKKRYEKDVIYTYIGHVLIAINPYKNIESYYNDRTLKDYRGKYQYELPPHVYAVADAMYRAMLQEGENQCVIISGESGAGKTVTSKHIMQFIAAVTGHNPEVARVKDIILESNPLLEAFGNAKTIRNNNSSRFGKYMEIQFGLSGDPEGGKITNYLLEKSRIVYQAQGERNFHVFYQLLAGADAKMKEEMALASPDKFFYLNQSGCVTVDDINDAQEFRDTMRAMDVVGISPVEKTELLRLCAAVLHLGNIDFHPDKQDHAIVRNRQALDNFAYLMQVDSKAAERSLVNRTIQTGDAGRSKRVSTYACPQTVEQAIYSRDALAKALYSRAFDWIVERVNVSLSTKAKDTFSIGVLDIYGFEIFRKNGFEQVCINYVNEKLQQIFIQLTLKAEQEEYAAEAIPWEPIEYFNNKICCDLIEAKRDPIGLLALLDDVCNFPKGDDKKFLEKIGETYMQHPHLNMSGGPNEFTINHYAGDVSYNVDGFVDKNKDFLFYDLIEIACQSQSSLIPGLFPEGTSLNDKKRPTTAGFKIKSSIQALVETLSKCQPHYIRCIKPNENKARNQFDSGLTQHQVRYLGLLENVRVRRAGFAYRHMYDKFFYRYRVCCDSTWPKWDGELKAGCQKILESMQLEQREVAYGKTKIFIRQPETVFSLEELRERKVHTYANRIQRFFLRFALRRHFWEIQVAANNSIVGKKERRRLSVNRPFTGDYINFRENYQLKALIEQHQQGREKVQFADVVNRYNSKGKADRRMLLITDEAVYLASIDKNKDKLTKKQKPFIFFLTRRTPIQSLNSATLTPFQDNFLNICIPAEYDDLLEARRKTEIIGTLLKHPKCPNFRIDISDTLETADKGKKGKKRVTKATMLPTGGEGRLKGKKISVAAGLSKDTKPNLVEPKQIQVHSIMPNNSGIQRKQQQQQQQQQAVAVPKSSSPFGGAGRGSPASSAFPRSNPTVGGSSAKNLGTAYALFNFEAENPDELNFREGEVVTILEKVEKDWWRGECNGQIGMFPVNYIQVVDGNAAPPAGRGRGASGPSGGPAAGRARGGSVRGSSRGAVGGPPRGGGGRGRGF